jgi:hypothetical protein
MAKIDKSQYSKEEWRKIKEQRNQEKQQRLLNEAVVASSPSTQNKYYFLCLKHGTKYSADYVNKLYNMVKRNCTLDYEFVCLTDDAKDINENVKIIPLPGGIGGWWCKPYMFSKDLPISGTVLYMDLDVVIAGNIDKLFTYSPNHWCIIRDFTRAMRPKWHKYNSSVIRFETGQLDFVWEEFINDNITIQRKYHGDQDYLYEATYKRKAPMLYPDSWVQSWKWEVRKSKDFAPGGIRGHRKLKIIETVTPRVECCVCVFHGDPNPHNCEDPWVVNNWR